MEVANTNAVVAMLKKGKENIMLFFEEFYANEYEYRLKRTDVESEVKDATEKIFTNKDSKADN